MVFFIPITPKNPYFLVCDIILLSNGNGNGNGRHGRKAKNQSLSIRGIIRVSKGTALAGNYFPLDILFIDNKIGVSETG